MGEHLPGKHKTLSSVPSTAKIINEVKMCFPFPSIFLPAWDANGTARAGAAFSDYNAMRNEVTF
jgi:hypothetical protein